MRPIRAILFEPNCLADAEGPFEDVTPAFAELQAMGIQLHTAADPAETLYITDNAEGLAKAKAAGMIPILLMHDPDEAMRLVANNPAGGIVSLLELPDLIRFVAAGNSATTPAPSPLLSAP
jgi:beta-phosphoglucomutase-like phosphatase (HAD superfamily)